MAPKRPGEIVSGAFATFAEHWQQLILFSIVYVVVLFVIGLLIGLLFEAIADSVAGATIAALVSVGLFLVASFAFTGAVTRLVASDLAGTPTTVSESMRYGMRNIGPIALVSVLVFTIILVEMLIGIFIAVAIDAALWLLLVMLGAFFVGFVFSMAIPALVIEGIHGTATLSRSWQLITTNFGHALGTFVLAYLVVLAVGIVAGIIGSASDVLRAIVNVALQLVVLPFFSLVLVGLYLNLRVRTGGLTTATLQEELRRGA